MSTQAKLLKDVPVIDIGADTPVLALDSSGAVGKGALAESVGRCGNIVDFPKAEQGDWWRIANIDFCGVGIICIRELWTQSSPHPVVLGVALDAYPGGNSTNEKGIKVLAGNSNRISKIRFVVDVPNKANDGWLDICIPHTDKYKSRRTQIASYGLGIRPVKLAEAPSVDNAHFVKEFDMTTLQSNSGGVISRTAIGPYLVAYKEKGGPHERWKNPFSYETSGADDGRVGISGDLLRLQRHCQSPDRRLSNGLCVHKHSGRGEVGLHDCDKRRLQTRYCNVAYRYTAVPSVGTWIPSIYGADAGLAHPDLTPRKEVVAA